MNWSFFDKEIPKLFGIITIVIWYCFVFILAMHPEFYYLGFFIPLVISIALVITLLIFNKKSRKFVILSTIILWTLCYFSIPLKIGFLSAYSKLSSVVNQSNSYKNINTDFSVGFYNISAKVSNERNNIDNPHCDNSQRKMYFLDWDNAFIYSEIGIDNLCYNPGNKGHLFGNWYWIAED